MNKNKVYTVHNSLDGSQVLGPFRTEKGAMIMGESLGYPFFIVEDYR